MDQGHEETTDGCEEHFIQSEQFPCVNPKEECETAANLLYDYCEDLKPPISENPTAKQLGDVAQSMIDSLNKKRNNDTGLLNEYRLGLESHTQKVVQLMEEQLFRLHETQNEAVSASLHQLFSCIDNITASQNELDKFKASLRALYEEMHGTT